MKTAILSLLLTLIAAGAGLYYVEQYQHFVLQSQAAQSKLETKIDTEIKPALARLETKFQDVKQDEHWKVSEVIYLLRLSNEQLKSSGDVQTSLRLLNAADEQLKTISDPTLHPVREMIGKERHALENLKLPDLQGLWIDVGLMIDKLERLTPRGVKIESSSATPEKNSTSTSTSSAHTQSSDPIPPSPSMSTETTDTHWKTNLKKTLNKLNDIIKIQRHTKPIEPILPQYEQSLAKTNLRLLLDQLRWSILNKQPKIYESLIKEIDQWLDSYFDNTDETVKNMRKSLQEMSKIDLRPPLPEIGQALTLLQKR